MFNNIFMFLKSSYYLHFNNRNAIFFLVLLFSFVAVPRLIFYDLDHGDEWTDACALSAGENFSKFGFIKCHFLPAVEVSSDEPRGFYTHQPPLIDNFNGLLRLIFNTNSLYFFRIISLISSFIGILFWYFFIVKLSDSPAIAFLSAVFYITNPIFIYCMDSLHESCYSEVSKLAIFLSFLSFLGSNGRKKQLSLIILWFMVLINALMAFEYIPYLVIFFILFGYLYKEHRYNMSAKVIFILFTAIICAFFLHFLQNVWHFGSFSQALGDLKDAAEKRTFGSYEISGGLNFLVWWKFVIIQNLSRVFIFNGSIIFLSIFFSFLLYLNLSFSIKDKINNLVKLFIVLVICGVSWYIFFPAHSLSHSGLMFLTRHLLPSAPLGFVIFLYVIFSFIKEKITYNQYFLSRIFSSAFILIVVFSGTIKSELPVTPRKIIFTEQFITFKKCLLELKGRTNKKDIIGVNYFRYPFMRYYMQRSFVRSFDMQGLEALPKLPEYFIFIPYNDTTTQSLLQFLNEKYIFLFECKSLRFPSVFFKLKNM